MKYYDLGHVAITSVPKCGTKSIAEALGDNREAHPEYVKGKRIVAFIRHPISRLLSAYRYFNWTVGWQPDMMFYDKRYNANVPYEEFVDMVLWGKPNQHWDSQSAQLRYNGEFMPTQVFRFEDINEVWPTLTDLPLGRINRSKRVEVAEDYRIDDLERFYSEDMERWDAAHQRLPARRQHAG